MSTKSEDPKIKGLATTGHAHMVHVADSDEQKHVVAWKLSVLILPDEDGWFAQGIEVNYGAQGDTPEEAQQNFQDGLQATMQQHIRIYGHVKGMLKFAPDHIQVVAAENKSSIRPFTQVSFLEIMKEANAATGWPYDQISYQVLAAAA